MVDNNNDVKSNNDRYTIWSRPLLWQLQVERDREIERGKNRSLYVVLEST